MMILLQQNRALLARLNARAGKVVVEIQQTDLSVTNGTGHNEDEDGAQARTRAVKKVGLPHRSLEEQKTVLRGAGPEDKAMTRSGSI